MNNAKSILKRKNEADKNAPSTPAEAVPEMERKSMLVGKSCNDWLKEAVNEKDPDPLWKSLWYESEICCLFADTNLGKSILSVQIAEEIAKSKRVALFDFELTAKQFQIRYTNQATGKLHDFPHNLFRYQIDPEALAESQMEERFEDYILKEIESTAVQTDSKVLIIDNLTWLCNNSEKGDAAGRLMKALYRLKMLYGWSVLIIAHTPKLPLGEPITRNSLAGSKKIISFLDSAFAIGQSASDPALRYIKQIKVRYGAEEYGADNVLVCEICKEDDFVHFGERECTKESVHLWKPTDKDDRNAQIISLHEDGKSLQEIANQLHMSKSGVRKVLKTLESSNNNK